MLIKENIKKYIILGLSLAHFRVYRQKQTITFGEIKRSLVIFGRNKSGKTALVDALEVGLSSDGTVKRLSEGKSVKQSKGGQEALVNYHSELWHRKALVQVVVKPPDDGKSNQFTINRIIGKPDKKNLLPTLNFFQKYQFYQLYVVKI